MLYTLLFDINFVLRSEFFEHRILIIITLTPIAIEHFRITTLRFINQIIVLYR